MRSTQSMLTAATVALALSSAAFVARADENPAKLTAALQAPVTLAQAIGAAEQKVQGRATSAEFDRHMGGYVYEVKVANAQQQRFKVLVDATNGSVVGVREKLPKQPREGGWRDVR